MIIIKTIKMPSLFGLKKFIKWTKRPKKVK